LYSVTCSACHGVDLRGGQLGGPNLLRSQLMLNDQHGELLLPVIRGSRAEKGMPPLPMSEDDVKAVAEFIHSVAASSRGQGAPPGSDAPPPDPVVGNASAGQAYFAAKCSACHSATGDLQGIATRVPEPRALQNLWVSGGGGRGGRGRGDASRRRVTATVALHSGETLEGELLRLDDFLLTLRLADGTIRSVRRDGDVPKVVIRDPLEPHRELLKVYTDKDMHDVTAYLVTLK
jgi:cytochrome c oxidase cbb3-type subunit 3